MFPSVVVPSSGRYLIGLAVSVLVLGGCGGGSTYSLDAGTLAQRFLPTERTVRYHPDSLGALSIEEEDGTVTFDLEDGYEALHRRWSCTYQDLGAGRSRRGRSYATLWSLELSLASLQPEVGITSLSADQAQDALKERRQEYQTTLQIDVYWFEMEGSSLVAGPGSRVELRVGDDEYRPTKETHGPLREAFLTGTSQRALYRRNTFYFSRIVEDTDILKEAQRVELHLNRTGAGSNVRFAWSWTGRGPESAELGGGASVRGSTRGALPFRRRGLGVPTPLKASRADTDLPADG